MLGYFLFVLVAFSSESSLCIFTILFKMGCLAAVAYSATVNTVITIKMLCRAAVQCLSYLLFLFTTVCVWNYQICLLMFLVHFISVCQSLYSIV